MPGFVKTKHDEELWSEAKAEAGKSYTSGSDAYWAVANKVFHSKKKKHKKDASWSGHQGFLIRLSSSAT